MASVAIPTSRLSEQDQDVLRSIAFTAAALDLHPQTVYEWAREGKIKSVKLGNARKISDSEIRRVQQEGV